MIQNIIFDLGGVVFDWDPDAIIRTVYGDPVAQALMKHKIFEHPDWLDTDRGTLSRTEAVVRWSTRTGRPAAEIDALMTATDVAMQPKRGTLALIDEVADRGLAVYCLSNMPAERYDYLRRNYDFWGKFSGIVISAHVGMIKPDPEIYRYLINQYSLDTKATLFVDDSARNLAGARSAGIQGVLFTTAERCRQQLSRLGCI